MPMKDQERLSKLRTRLADADFDLLAAAEDLRKARAALEREQTDAELDERTPAAAR
jgi:hypothetical protein